MRRRYQVEGTVQGVGFRHFTWRVATRLRLAGWVRNLADGSVEVVASGDPGQLSQLERELRRGPGMSSVTNVHVTEISDEIQPRSFEIR